MKTKLSWQRRVLIKTNKTEPPHHPRNLNPAIRPNQNKHPRRYRTNASPDPDTTDKPTIKDTDTRATNTAGHHHKNPEKQATNQEPSYKDEAHGRAPTDLVDANNPINNNTNQRPRSYVTKEHKELTRSCSIHTVEEQERTDLNQRDDSTVKDEYILSWIIVNIGLFYMFLNLKQPFHQQLGVNYANIHEYSQQLRDNIETAMQSLRLCNDPSMEACQALALLYTFCNKSGRSALAWQMISAASRMCIDLGWHRLPKEGSKVSKERQIFWHIYIHDKGMAFTLGRSPSIHPCDVSTPKPTVPDDYVPGVPVHLYSGYVDYAIIVGDMHIELFSASALQQPQQIRVETAKTFAVKIIQTNKDIKKALHNNPPMNDIYKAPIMLFDMIMYSLVTMAYRIVPCEGQEPNSLQCNVACIDAARKALTTLVEAFNDWGNDKQTSWTMLLNIMFSMIPFAAFVVLAGNTIATSSIDDLALLAATVSALEPTSTSSPSAKKLYNVCKTFHELASFAIARRTVLEGTPP
ncbi:hypothetical protein K456DRAFT_1730682 [Colletotrichum gloeosporioides 23]|nr:hypothetical protein K456DRAFT_1730682 [Colletotrichum gloeosporioides 23]